MECESKVLQDLTKLNTDCSQVSLPLGVEGNGRYGCHDDGHAERDGHEQHDDVFGPVQQRLVVVLLVLVRADSALSAAAAAAASAPVPSPTARSPAVGLTVRILAGSTCLKLQAIKMSANPVCKIPLCGETYAQMSSSEHERCIFNVQT